jgi:uncharacterized membrane protein
MKITISDIAQVAIFSALACAGGYLLIAVPNVEIVTAIIFLSGYYLGSKKGMLVGLIAQSLYSIINPYGVSPPPLFVAQVLNRVLLGFVGGRLQSFWDSEREIWVNALTLGAAGLLLTWLYDVTTDFSFFFVSGFSLQQMKTTFALGLPFYLLHGFVNTAIFALVLPVVFRELKRLELSKTANLS